MEMPDLFQEQHEEPHRQAEEQPVVINYDEIEERMKIPLRALNQNIIDVKSMMNTLEVKISAQQELINQLEETNRHQQQVIQAFQNDPLLKTKMPLFMELIQLGDSIREFKRAENEKKIEGNQPYADLLSYINKMEDYVDSILRDNSVKRYQQEGIGEFNPKMQEITAHEKTDDPTLAGRVKSVMPGYCWTIPYLIINSEVKLVKVAQENNIPQKFTFVLRLEEVKQFER